MKFDVIVIGSGPGGYVAAIRAAQLGLKTACIEKGPLGGTCLNVGCIPSKALLHSSGLYDTCKRHMQEHGIYAEKVRCDFDAMMRRKAGIVAGFNRGIESLFKKNQVALFRGEGRLRDAQSVEVNGEVLKAASMILATGSEPIALPFLPIDEKRVMTSTGALSLEQVPNRLLVIGAGVIGVELGSVYNRLGAEVTVIEFLPNILPTMDVDIADTFQTILEKQGLHFHLLSQVTSADMQEAGVTLRVASGGETQLFEGDVVLCSIGRRPYLNNLGLETVGITPNSKGYIPVNGRFQTAVKTIFAIGDMIDGPMLAHKASEEGLAVAEILAGQRPYIEYIAIPNVVYTDPEVAAVGLTEQQARDNQFEVRVGRFPYKTNARATCMGQEEGLVKVVADAKTDTLLGVHIVGAHASEIIAAGVVAVQNRVSVLDFAHAPHAHPTLAEAVKEAALDCFGRAIHR